MKTLAHKGGWYIQHPSAANYILYVLVIDAPLIAAILTLIHCVSCRYLLCSINRLSSGGIMGFIRRAIALSFCLLLVACATPRGAGFEAEVLAADTTRDANGVLTTNFSVFAVTRDVLPRLNSWPATGGTHYAWIRRQVQPASLIIAPGDKLLITVWDAEENSLLTGPEARVAQLQEIQVGPDGRIFIPFVGDLKVGGMAPATARARIEEQLIQTIPSAQVQLNVAAGRANTANLVAGVASPGVYPLPDRDFTLLGLLAQGGGVPDGIVNPQVRLMRGDQIYGTSLSRLYEDPTLDTTLRGGDRVIVEKEDRYFIALGAAGKEALHIFPKDEVTALDALAIVGGVADNRADPKGILILREYPQSVIGQGGNLPPQERIVFTMDLTSADGLFSAGKFHVMPGDLVYATESPIVAVGSVLGLVSSLTLFRNQLM